MAKIGDLCETKGEITVEWTIKDFSSLHQLIDVPYESPKFYFCGASWSIWLYPNGETRNESNGWLSLYLMRLSSGSPVTLTYSFCLESYNGYHNVNITEIGDFNEKEAGKGKSKVILNTSFMEKKSQLIPSDILTVVCCLKNNKTNDVTSK